MNSRLTEKCFKNMNGAYAALFTPFDAKGRVNPEMIEKIVNYGIRNGLNGFYLTGTTGEWWLLSLDERKHVMESAVKADFKTAAKWQDEANQVVELMIESDNWSYRKAMMKFIGLDCGSYRKPFEPLTAAQCTAYAKRFAKLGIVKPGQGLE